MGLVFVVVLHLMVNGLLAVRPLNTEGKRFKIGLKSSPLREIEEGM
jgi:hypothetical protein